MKIFTFQAGLGNQIFQYVYYTYLRKKYPSDRFYGYYPDRALSSHNGLEIDKWFDIQLPASSIFSNLIANSLFVINKIAWKLQIKHPVTDTDWFRRDEALFYSGYWQQKKYFIEVGAPEFRKDLVLGDNNMKVLSEIQKTNSVVVHVRRGDYLSNEKAKSIYGGICTNEYYRKAINIIKDKIVNVKFFFFSDDIEYVNTQFPDIEKTVISWNKGENSFYDLYLMSFGKSMIIANSTFSCWAAYLNKNKPLVICPKKWRNDKPSPDVLLDDWIKI